MVHERKDKKTKRQKDKKVERQKDRKKEHELGPEIYLIFEKFFL